MANGLIGAGGPIAILLVARGKDHVEEAVIRQNLRMVEKTVMVTFFGCNRIKC